MRPQLTVLALAALLTSAAHAQQSVPIVDLPPATARSQSTFGGIIGVREVTGGFVLVNDGARRQIKRYDPTLTKFTLVADSTRGAPDSYGPVRTRLMPYFGDSSLFADFESKTMLVLDGNGKAAKALALPNAADFPPIITGTTTADPKGRLLYVVWRTLQQVTGPPTMFPLDSAVILRADLDARRIDTLARFKVHDGGGLIQGNSVPDKPKLTLTINPLPVFDDWAMLSDGTIALVRGHDYHIDWIHPDGTRNATPKMAFDWKRVTDEDKRKLIDSARAANEAEMAAMNKLARPVAPGGDRPARDGGGGGGGDPPQPPGGFPPVTLAFPPLNQITDYWPAIRLGAAVPDLDNNLWILPTTSAQSLHGELVYDVVNAKGALFERVRLPAGRSLVGFAKAGVVYLAFGDRTNGFVLERTQLPGGAAKAR